MRKTTARGRGVMVMVAMVVSSGMTKSGVSNKE